jgi:retron-type reverse transcriptase
MMMSNTKCKAKVQNTLSEVNRGLTQGDLLSPILFNIAMEQAARAIRTNPGGTINNRMTQIMTYADDTLLPARTKTALSDALQEFEGAARNLGLKIN